jgi:hypothetical protein
MTTESPLERVCREAREREDAILSSPNDYSPAEVQAAHLAVYQRERLALADILRHD